MAIKAKLGQFNATTGVVNHTLTVSGAFDFEPKIILYWWNSTPTASGNILASGIPRTELGMGGMINGVIRFANNYSVDNNVTTSVSRSSLFNTYVMRTYADYWDYSYLWLQTTSGFRWVADSAIDNPYRITYLGLGGNDLTNAWIGDFYSRTTTGYINIITSGYQSSYFQPDAVMCFSIYNTTFADVTDSRGSIGFATGSGNQGVITNYDDSGIGTTNSFGMGYNDSLIRLYDVNKNLVNKISFVEFHASGFILNQEIAAASAYRNIYVALKGGKYKVNNIITTTGYSNISTNDGFEPRAILFLSANKELSSGISDNFSMSVGGIATSQEIGIKSNVVSLWDEDNLDFSEGQFANYEGVSVSVKHNSIVGLTKYKAINPEIGFITTMDIPYDTPNFITYLSIGDTNPIKRTTKSAFTYGKTFDKHSAYAYGHSPNGLEIRAFTHGAEANFRSNKSSYCRGGIIINDSQGAYTNFTTPKIFSRTGYFNIDTSKTVGQYITVSGLDFQGKVLLLYWIGGTIDNINNMYDKSTWPSDSTNLNIGFGAAIDSTHRFCVDGFTDSYATVMNTFRSQNNTEIMRAYTPSGTTSLDGILDFDSFTSDGFKLVVDDQFSYPYAVGFMVLGGDDLTNVYIGNGTLPTATGIFNVESAGFEPDALILTTQSQTNLVEISDHRLFSLGFTDGTNQVVISTLDKDNTPDSTTRRYNSLNKIYANINPTTLSTDIEGSFVDFIPNGFRLNHLLGSTSNIFNYIALKGGRYKVKDFLSGTEVGPIYTVSGIGFKPNTLMMISSSHDGYDSVTTDDIQSVGFTTIDYGQESEKEFNQIAQGYYSRTGYTNASTIWKLTNVSYINEDYAAYLDVLGFNSDGFDFTMLDYDYSNINIFALAICPGISTYSSKSAYISAATISTSNKYAYLEGTTTPVSKGYHHAYICGKAFSESSKSCYMNSGYGFTITQVYIDLNVVTPSASLIHAYLNGGTGNLDYKHAYTVGGIINYKHVYTEGYLPNQTVKHAYLNGTMGDFGPKAWIS